MRRQGVRHTRDGLRRAPPRARRGAAPNRAVEPRHTHTHTHGLDALLFLRGASPSAVVHSVPLPPWEWLGPTRPFARARCPRSKGIGFCSVGLCAARLANPRVIASPGGNDATGPAGLSSGSRLGTRAAISPVQEWRFSGGSTGRWVIGPSVPPPNGHAHAMSHSEREWLPRRESLRCASEEDRPLLPLAHDFSSPREPYLARPRPVRVPGC